MKARLLILLCVVILCNNYTTVAQQKMSKANRLAFSEANRLMADGKLRQAAKIYENILQTETEDLEVLFTASICYLKENRGNLARPHLDKLYRLAPNYHPGLRFMVGLSQQQDNKFNDAIQHFQYIRSMLGSAKGNNKREVEALEELMDVITLRKEPDPRETDADKRIRHQNLVSRKIRECETGIKQRNNAMNVRIENVGDAINSMWGDYVPVISSDESMMVFTSRREGGIGSKKDEYGDWFEDVYVSQKEKDGTWKPASNIGRGINTDEHDAAVALSPDGKRLYLYKVENNGDLYYSDYFKGNWSKPQSVGKPINSKYSELSISTTNDGKTVYFSSDRPGGYGGFDIYMCKMLDNGKWSEPTNLGPVINTPDDEDAPFIHPDGITLYFSSRGHEGLGGYDIFMSNFEHGAWQAPENIGYPINTALDDIYFVISADGRHGYYSSEKVGGQGEKDIYRIVMPKVVVAEMMAAKEVEKPMTRVTPLKPKANISSKGEVTEVKSAITILKGNVIDAFTKEPLDAKITLIDNKDGSLVSEIVTQAAEGGKYIVTMPSGRNYGIAIEKENYLFHSENFDIPASSDYQEVQKDIELKKIAVGTKIVLRNIFYDFAKATLRPESKYELERLLELLNEIPALKIEIAGHTDNVGTDERNQLLSENRAKSVVEYLIDRGIDASRLKAAGYGSKRPIAENTTEEGRQLNRRTEFEVLAN
jgi:outer membrane protein OmpA-like peptidoglycan-associated protein/tetratricopeptide (TPR) repeat protein